MKSKTIIIATIFFVSIAAIAVILQYHHGQPSETLEVPTKGQPDIQAIGGTVTFAQRSPAEFSAKGKATPVIIFSKQISTIESGSRGWAVVRIMRKTGDAAPEVLAEVGSVGEYPGGYQISPDKKYLLINLESKIKILNLTNKELKDLFVPIRQVLGMSYSPDGSQLLIWDQKYVPLDKVNSYYVHKFTIVTRNDEVLHDGISEGPFFGDAWRHDGKVILLMPQGHSSTAYYFDLDTKKIVKSPVTENPGLLSKSGRVMAVVTGHTSDICNEMTGFSPAVYSFVDPVSGNSTGTISSKQSRVSVLAFSSDEKEVFYQSIKIPARSEECETAERKYFRARIGTNEIYEINNPLALPLGWNNNYLGAVIHFDWKKRIWSLLVGDQPIFRSNSALQVIAEYYL